MTCFHPLPAYRDINGQIRFDEKNNGDPLEIPCGQCLGCRLKRSREWAMRCIHEASTHEENVFITLTYNAENLPPDGGLRKKDFQDFMKRYRKAYPGKKIRYYHCGEYGDRNTRPHYHAIVFGHNFDDWVYLFDSPAGQPIYTSKKLEKIWQKGFVTVGEVTFESSGYVARYCLKKQTGKLKDSINPETGLKPYERVCSFTGNVHEVLPEYATMSRRPGIGRDWIARYTLDCYPKDFTTINGSKIALPRYYDKYLESIDIDMYDDIKAGRQYDAYLSDDNNELRLSAKEKVKEAQIKQCVRSI
jgi:hypothetical protein